MDIQAYRIEAEQQKNHWWFVGRRRLFAREILKLRINQNANVLDLGTSTGTNLKMLVEMKFTKIQGLDFSEEALKFCAEKNYPPVTLGDICDLPFQNQKYDLVLATDIIEHVEDDQEAVNEIYRILKPGGRALITVPAFLSLWGRNDDTAHHKRRYKSEQLLDLIKLSGFKVSTDYYFNFLLFVPIWIVRKLTRKLNIEPESENQLTPGIINKILKVLFMMDIFLSPKLRMPFGVSYLCVIEKP